MKAAQHTSELLQELDSAEEKIALMLELAASTAEKLLDFKNVDTESVGASSNRFLQVSFALFVLCSTFSLQWHSL
jgi:hypothetical protein